MLLNTAPKKNSLFNVASTGLILLTLLFIPSLSSALPTIGTTIQLPGKAEFVEQDTVRNLLYVSIPSQNQVVVLSKNDLQIVDTIDFVGEPYGLDISDDNNTLYVALSGTGTVGVVDLTNSNAITAEIDVTGGITPDGNTLIDKVFSVQSIDNRVFASADSSNGLSNVIVIDLANSNAISRIGLLEDDSFLVVRRNPHLRINDAGTEIILPRFVSGLVRVDIVDRTYPLIFSDRNMVGELIALEIEGDRYITSAGSEIDAQNFELFERYTGRNFVSSADQEYILGTDGIRDDLVSYRAGFSSETVSSVDGNSVDNICGVSTLSSDLYKPIVAESDGNGLFLFRPNGLVCFFSQDTDLDNRFDLVDNCPQVSNPGQSNIDADNLGDACDEDDDDDGIPDVNDPFPLSADGDNDGVDDPDDAYPTFFGAATDTDGDGLPDRFFDTCDIDCQANSGLIEDLDDDNDQIPDALDDQPIVQSQAAVPFDLNAVRFTNLDGEPADMVIDSDRAFAYVSVPSQKRIYWISLKNLSQVFNREVAGAPNALELSPDGTKLVVGLNDSGKVEAIDLTSPELESKIIDISRELRDDPVDRNTIISDIAITGNRIFIAGSEFASPLIELTLDTLEITEISDFTISSQAFLQIDETAQVLYIETLSRVAAVDISTSTATTIASELVSPPVIKPGFTLSPNKDFLFLGNGRIVPTDFSVDGLESFTETIEYQTFESGSITAASPVPSEQSIVDTAADVIFSFDTSSFTKTGQLISPCEGLNPANVPLFAHAQEDKGWLVTVEDGSQHRVCFQPRPIDYEDGFADAPTNTNINDYFLLGDTTPIFYTEPNISFFSQTFSPILTNINGIPHFELVDSRGASEFYFRNSEGVFLSQLTEPGGNLLFSNPVPVLPQQMRQGYRNFSSGELTIQLQGLPDRIRRYNAEIIIDDFRQITLADKVDINAFRIRRETTLSPNTTVETSVVEQFWFAEEFGLVRIDDNGFTTTLAFASPDSDRDGVIDFFDSDDDNDGVPDTADAFPLNPLESSDFDGDGIGDNRDTDDDNDGIPDSFEIANGLNPRNAADGRQDPDGDGRDNATEFRQGTDLFVADQGPSVPIITPTLQLLLGD